MSVSLSPQQARWIDYVENNVVSKLPGSAAERARTAALVMWWALKEGILNLQNPLRHNLCSATGETQIGDLGVCPSGAWQIGISGIQGGSVSLEAAERTARQIYPRQSIPALLRRIATDAGVTGAARETIANSTGLLRKSWLLRDPAIGITLQRPFVERGCFREGAPSWCYGGWDTARAYASSTARVREVVGALENRFRSAGASVLPWLAVAAGAGLIGYGYWQMKR